MGEEYNNKTSEGDRVSWNMADALMKEIGTHLSEANDLLVIGYPSALQKAYRELQAVKRRFIQSLGKTERDDLSKREIRINYVTGKFNHFNGLNKRHDTRTSETIQSANHYLNRLRIRLENYNEFLMDLLEDKGYLIQKQKDTKSMM